MIRSNKATSVKMIFNFIFIYTLFIINNTYKQSQNELGQKLSNSLRLGFHYLKIIRFLHPRYHSQIIEDSLKIVQKINASVLMKLYDLRQSK